jgi:hypothetical protein
MTIFAAISYAKGVLKPPSEARMISIVILLIREQDSWQISRCAVNFGDGRIRSIPCPTRTFSPQTAAINAMKRRAMQYLRQKGYADSPLDIEWHVEVVDPPYGPRDPGNL